MHKDHSISQESFDGLLAWLDQNRERAGEKYEAIRSRLIKIFACRGCGEADALADETIDRVIRKVASLTGAYTGDPALYFYGVANKVYLEYLRRPAPRPPVLPEPAADEQEYACLESCIERLPPAHRELILQYYQDCGRAKITRRTGLAQKLGVAPNALRIRAYRLRATLHACVEECLKSQAAG